MTADPPSWRNGAVEGVDNGGLTYDINVLYLYHT